MEHLLASWLNPAQLGRMTESTGQSVSLDEVAEVATSSFRSAMGTSPSATREDSLVLILGLLNLGTVLCYAIYAHLFKPFNRFHHPLVDDPQFLYKRIQNIMDELVLHVHTTSYYKRVSEEVPNSSSNTVRSMRGRSAGPKVFNFFSFHDDDSSGAISSRMASKEYGRDYQTYLNYQTKKMMKDWLNIVIPQSAAVSGRRLTKRQAPMMRRRRPNFRHINGTGSLLYRQRIGGEQSLRRRNNDSSPLMTKLKSSNRNEQPQIVGSSSRRPVVSKVETDGPVAVPSSMTPLTISTPAEPDYVTIPPRHVPVHPPAVGASSPPTPSSRIPFPRSGTVNAGLDARAVKKPRLDSLNIGGHQQQPRIPPQDLHQAQSQLQWTSAKEEAIAPYPFIGRLMGLIRQTTPLTMDVLGVYDQTQDVAHGKCLERLLCQLNQDWKNQGTVSAALAPFLSITTGWWSDGASLSHILMATRAGWIGKHCSSLYPQCPNPSRTQWTLTPSASSHQEPADSMNLPSLDQIPIKVRPPIDFTATITTTVRPGSSSIPPPPSSFRINLPISSKSPPVTTTPVSISTTKDNIGIDRDGQGVEEEEEDEEEEENDENEEEAGSNVALIPTTGNPISIENQMQSTTERSKPWGKPSRFSGMDDVTLSDIVRGIYSNSEEYDEENLDEEDDAEEEEEEEDVDGSTEQSTSNADILHDLKKHHFTTTARPHHLGRPTKTTPSRTLLEEAYQEAQKKKTTRLEMVPHRGLVHPWLAEPVWAPDNPWPLRPENNHLRMNEDHDDPSKERHRDKVSFSQEDAVKDTRLFEFAMQYLRDRSA